MAREIRYLFAERTFTRKTEIGCLCSSCGISLELFDATVVEVSVGDGQDGGGVDRFAYCDICLIQQAPALVLAGSTAPLVAGYPEDRQPE